MSTETNNFVSALAQCNGVIPSLHNLTVETIKAFVNPGIKELEKNLLIAMLGLHSTGDIKRDELKEEILESIEDVREWVETTRERAHYHKDQIVEMLQNQHLQLEKKVDNVMSELERMNENLDSLRRFCEGC